MRQVLFLDDDPNRIKKFRSVLPYAEIVDNAQDCINRLSKQNWEVVCLDHDLGGEIFVAPEHDNTGFEVVRWIEANQPKIDVVYVHSFNTPAAFQMLKALNQAGYRAIYSPFGVEYINDVYEYLTITPAE